MILFNVKILKVFCKFVKQSLFYYYYKSESFCLKRFFYLLINVVIVLKTIILYIKKLLYLKSFGTECELQI